MAADGPWAALRPAAAAAAELVRRGRGGVHLMGAGGVGVAGLAALLQARGFDVSGCDLAPGAMGAWLAARGVPCAEGHAAGHVRPGLAALVRSGAVPADHAEPAAARARGVPVFLRGCVLPALLEGRRSAAVAGTHGKTTTTAMLVQALRACGVNAGFAIGGESPALGGVAGDGDGRTLAVEADESDGTLALYAPEVAVITNVELDHADYFDAEATLRACFAAFAAQAARTVYCADDPGARAAAAGRPAACGYGFSADADVRGTSVRLEAASASCRVAGLAAAPLELALPVPGRHNLLNAIGALAAAARLGADAAAAAASLRAFAPARRRFERVAEGHGLLVISDYAHHPTEIRALMAQAAGLGRRLVVVFQPHRYTRTRALAADFPAAFRGAARVVLAPVYAAAEAPVPGGTSADLAARFDPASDPPVELADDLDDAWRRVRGGLRAGDALLVVGAGDVERLARLAKDALIGGASSGNNRAP